MGKLLQDIQTTMVNLKVEHTLMSSSVAKQLIENTVNIYMQNGKGKYPLSDYIEDYESLYDPQGWEQIGLPCSGKETIMFFEVNDEKDCVIFNDGKNVSLVLGEMYAFNFYLTDIDSTFLLTYTKHEYIKAAGCFKEWLIEKKKAMQ